MNAHSEIIACKVGCIDALLFFAFWLCVGLVSTAQPSTFLPTIVSFLVPASALVGWRGAASVRLILADIASLQRAAVEGFACGTGFVFVIWLWGASNAALAAGTALDGLSPLQPEFWATAATSLVPAFGIGGFFGSLHGIVLLYFNRWLVMANSSINSSINTDAGDKTDQQNHDSDFAEIFDNFKNRMVEIEFSRRELKTIHEKALKEAIQNADFLKKISDKSDGIYNSLHAMFFSHPDTGVLAPYGFKEQTPDEKIENIKIQLNKQYCWLLAEAYEEFEDFLEHVYARVGYLNPEAWPMTDFGGISIRDIESKPLDWFINQSRSKKNGSRGIVNQLNKEFPEIKELCEKNKYLGNITFQFTVIEKMRHIIVHNRGQVKDREKFTEVIFKDFGISTNGESAEHYKGIINYYLATVRRSGEDIIYLLDRPIKGMEPLNATTPIFEHLVGLLLAFSLIVCRILRARVEKLGSEG